ncbi:hypothetical protein HELRODRAFT_182440 [Helobdella robusta]|uniref:Uncharacterized protein n=1 Tax=Helobdella robusta TaxID=6412 RepID=T1FI73_HELRO|nr:hypothetical protein HELRODRAFT_182440 [Helobdella robusta]ESN90967.1 hypothetical protein HELRODRAFT_182440 [Helobdella robusta]
MEIFDNNQGHLRYNCLDHFMEVLYICKPCRQPICQYCHVYQHNTHEVMLVSDVIDKNKTFLDNYAQLAETEIKNVDENIERLMPYTANANRAFEEMQAYYSREMEKFENDEIHKSLTSLRNDRTKLKNIYMDCKLKRRNMKFLVENEARDMDIQLIGKFERNVLHVNYQQMESNLASFRNILRNSIIITGLKEDFASLVDEISCGSLVTCFAISDHKIHICTEDKLLIVNVFRPDEGIVEKTYKGLENLADILVYGNKFYFYLSKGATDVLTLRYPEFKKVENISCFSLSGDTIIAARQINVLDLETESLKLIRIQTSTLDLYQKKLYQKRLSKSNKGEFTLHNDEYILSVVKFRNENYLIATQTGLERFCRIKLWDIFMTWDAIKKLNGQDLLDSQHNHSARMYAYSRNMTSTAFLSLDSYDNIYVISNHIEENILVIDPKFNFLANITTEFVPKKLQITRDNTLYVSYVNEPHISIYKLNFFKRSDNMESDVQVDQTEQKEKETVKD